MQPQTKPGRDPSMGDAQTGQVSAPTAECVLSKQAYYSMCHRVNVQRYERFIGVSKSTFKGLNEKV